jgi:hypothetical protein
LPDKAVAGCFDGQSVWLLFESPILIKFGVSADPKGKQFAVKRQVSLPLAATRITMLEPGVACLTDAEGRLWFNKIDEAAEQIDESLSESRTVCEMVKIRQTELTTLDSLREDSLFVNILQHSERQELLRDRNFQVLKYELEAIQDYAKQILYSDFAFYREEITTIHAYHAEASLWLLFILSNLGYVYCYQAAIQQAHSSIGVGLSLVAEMKATDSKIAYPVFNVRQAGDRLEVTLSNGETAVKQLALRLSFNQSRQKFSI